MNLHQFRFIQEAARRNLNLTETARALYTSQPGISKAILELEDELGVDIFVRHGKRLRSITEPGQHVLRCVDIIMREVGNLRRIGEQYSAQDSGTFSIAATHTQARYVLPMPIAQMRANYPQVNISLHQGAPEQVARMVLDDAAEMGIATGALHEHNDLIALPCHEWQHTLVVPANHPLAQKEKLTLEDIAREPLITYHPAYSGRNRIDQAFARRNLAPRVVLEAIDADVIKTYVRLGLGAGIVSELAMRENVPDDTLVARPLGFLIGANVTHIAFKRGAWLRNFVFDFASILSPRLNKALIQRAMTGEGGTPDCGL